MPTKPNEEFVVRMIDNPQVDAELKNYSSIIDEIINYGSLVFGWAFANVHEGDQHVAMFALYRRSLELLDTLSILIRNACITPCKLLLRALFETVLFVEYITKENFEQRARDFILCVKHKELTVLKEHCPSDPLYSRYLTNLKNDSVFKNMPIVEIPEIEAAIKAKEILTNSNSYSASQEAYKATMERRKPYSPIWWFNLHDGPKSIFELAKAMQRPAQYKILYEDWAGYAHGTGSFDGQVEISSVGIAIPQIRLPKDAEFITFMAVSYGLTALRIMILMYAKERNVEFFEWYKREISSQYHDLKNRKIIIK
ncbi:MAG: hypothetical protein IMZ53_03280 [Thermoplasmata archaeon]|nr:hypothetical protein [Thermoplasmata archaeon]